MIFVLLMVVVLFDHITAQSSSGSLSNSSTACLTGAVPYHLSDSCPLGYYCPNYNKSDPSTYPVQCPPTNACLFDRLKSTFCPAQGTYEPTLCEEGYYCPSPIMQIRCPKGHFCPRGQYEPIACPVMTVCDEGSTKKGEWSSVIAILITDVTVVAVWIAFRVSRQKAIGNRAAAAAAMLGSADAMSVTSPSLMAKGDAYHQLPAYSKRLCKGFKRAQRQLPPMHLEFDQLSLTIPAKSGQPSKTILTGVTGTIEPGKVTAVMGPSGAGKTTFLNVLLGAVNRQWVRGGVLRVNGVQQSLRRFRKIMGYVPQEDIMQRDLTIHDNIEYSANIRLPRDWAPKQRQDQVNAVIAAMQLSHVQDSRIGDESTRGVSGGQRKRCNIGMEVVSAPGLLLLDEPTSGLDSTSAMDICQVLKDLARVSSLTVVMVIHQPRVEIWNQLDQLLLLAPGGVTVYQGPQRVALTYFRERLDVEIGVNENPADALMDRIAQQGDDFVKYWRDGGKEYVAKLVQQELERVPVGQGVHNEADHKEKSEQVEGSDDSDEEAAKPNALYPHTQLTMPGAESGAINICSNPRGGFQSEINSAFIPIPAGPVRSSASFNKQVWYSLKRSLVKQLATTSSLWLEVGLGFLAGVSMGAASLIKFQGILKPPFTILSPTPIDSAIGSTFFFMGLAISLAAASAGVKVFSEERTIYRREVAAGHSHLAYYIGTSVAQMPRLFLDAVHFAFIYHILSQPTTTFGEFLPMVFNLYVSTYGLAAIVSMLVSRTNAGLLAVLLSLLFAGMTAKGGQPEPIQMLSASRWAAEALFDRETAPYLHIMQVAESTAPRLGYTLGRFPQDLIVMFVIGIFYRIIAYLIMLWTDRELFEAKRYNALVRKCRALPIPCFR